MSSTTDRWNGKLKQATGNITNDKQLKKEGQAEEAKATMKDRAKQAGRTITDKA